MIVLTNITTYFHVNSYNKSLYKDKQDSLTLEYNKKEKDLLFQLEYRKHQIHRDSLALLKVIKYQKLDSILITKQAKDLNKYKHLTNDELLKDIDSAYKANN